MRVGDLVRYRLDPDASPLPDDLVGLVVRVDDSHRQHFMSVLFSDGLRKRIWEGHLEVFNEDR